MTSSARAAGFDETTLPRANGAPVFDEPWQARAMALAVLTVEAHDLPWDAFRQHLIAAVGDDPDRPYWESWVVALDGLVEEVSTP